MFTKLSLFVLIGILCLSNLRFCFANVEVGNNEVGNVEAIKNEVPVVSVKQGQIRGIAEESLNGRKFYSYMNIPYAQSPEGKLRFKAPVPLESWNDVLDGTKMPSPCCQKSFLSPPGKLILEGNEDCLRLNVFSHGTNQSNKILPVMVFIHGGGFMFGNAKEFLPHVLMNRDIVFVVIQYRLGIFGFLSTEDSVLPGNMGLKDQQLALKWVKENIAAFGGDPNSITIFGESAGGAGVHYQVLSPGSKGLFNRAIIQSGTALGPWATNKNHRKFAIETGQEFNCSIVHGSEIYLDCMQNVNPNYLTIASSKTDILGLVPFYVLPRVDGEFIDEAPEILMKKGKYNKVDIVAGNTRDEGAIDLMFDYINPKRRENINKNFETLGPLTLWFHDEENSLELTKQVYRYYLQREDLNTTKKDWREVVEMNSDRVIKVCHDITENFFASDQNITLFTYQLDHLSNVSVFDMFPGFEKRDVVSHGDDLMYLFHGGEFFKTKLEHEDDLKMREIFLDLWTSFAKTGNPTTPSGSGFIWEEATPNSFRHLSLTPSPVMKDDDFQKKREFWASLKTYQNSLLQSTSNETTVNGA